jgi:predicted nucleotidyltransferase
MKFLTVFKIFNQLKKKKVFQDYAIGEAVAVNYYAEPRNTIDLDLYFLVDDRGYHQLWQTLTDIGYKAQGQRIVVEGVPVDMFPVSVHPVFEEALRNAKQVRVTGVPIKVFTPEYLIVTKLMSFRPRDRADIYDLFEFGKVDKDVLNDIMRRFTNEETPLRKRLKSILG